MAPAVGLLGVAFGFGCRRLEAELPWGITGLYEGGCINAGSGGTTNPPQPSFSLALNQHRASFSAGCLLRAWAGACPRRADGATALLAVPGSASPVGLPLRCPEQVGCPSSLLLSDGACPAAAVHGSAGVRRAVLGAGQRSQPAAGSGATSEGVLGGWVL